MQIVKATRQPGQKHHQMTVNKKKLLQSKNKFSAHDAYKVVMKKRAWSAIMFFIFFFFFFWSANIPKHIIVLVQLLHRLILLWLQLKTKSSFFFLVLHVFSPNVSICVINRFSFILCAVAHVHDRNDILMILLACDKLFHQIVDNARVPLSM